jgi:hypothetical protein
VIRPAQACSSVQSIRGYLLQNLDGRTIDCRDCFVQVNDPKRVTTMWDDAQALSSRDPDGGGVPRTLVIPRTDRNDTMRIRGRVRTPEWPGIAGKHEQNSVSAGVVNPSSTIMADRRP